MKNSSINFKLIRHGVLFGNSDKIAANYVFHINVTMAEAFVNSA